MQHHRRPRQSGGGNLRVDESLAKQYAAHLHKLGFRSDVSDPTRWPGVFTLEQTGISAEVAQPFIEQAVDAALDQLLAMRRAEGENLKQDISARLDAARIAARQPPAIRPRKSSRAIAMPCASDWPMPACPCRSMTNDS